MLSNDNMATLEETQNELATLGNADLIRLRKLARYFIRGITTLEPNDLLHEAIVSILQGGRKGETRRWPKSIKFVTFLANVMKSIASSHRRQHIALLSTTSPLEDVEATLGEDSHEGNVIRFSEVEHELTLIKSVFQDDSEAAKILTLILDGIQKAEILKKTGLTQKQYDTVRKRIRRKTEHLNMHRRT